MRLIDADKLVFAIQYELWDWKSVDGITATTVLKQTISDIVNEPTVEAIPIEQLREWQKQYGNKCTYGHIMKLIEEWARENEI